MDEKNERVGKRRWLLVIGFLLIVSVTAVVMTVMSGIEPIALVDSRLISTTKPLSGLPPTATLSDRFFTALFDLQQRFRKPRPQNYSFPASPPVRCSIHGLLNQCMEVTGVRFLIAKDVAAGTVEFGNSNTLNGTEFVTAFTDALRLGQAEWWDPQAKRFRKERLILLTNSPKTIMVIPQEMALEFH